MVNFVYRFHQEPDRPAQVTYAVLFLYALLALQVALFLIQHIVLFMTIPEQFELGTAIIDIVVFVLITWFMFVVARKIGAGKNWARWLLLIGFIFIVTTRLCGLQIFLKGEAIGSIAVLGQVIVTGMAVTLLFQPSSSRWFSSKKRVFSPADLNRDSELEVYASQADVYSNLKNRVNAGWLSQFDSREKSLLGAALLYGVVGGLALWGPPALLIFTAEPIGSLEPTSLDQKLMIFATGSIVAICIGLPLTYIAGKRSIKFGVLIVGATILLVSLVLTTFAGM